MSTDRRHPEHEEALLLRDAMIAGLAGAANDVADVGRELYKATVMSRIQRVVIFATLALVFVMLVAQLITSQINRSTLDAVKDCTEPGGECFRRGQENTAKAVELLMTRSEAANYCSPRVMGIAQYKTCIAAYPGVPASLPLAPHHPQVPASR